MMNKILTTPAFTALTCFAATIVGHGLHVLIYHNTFNLEEALFEAALFAVIGFAGMATKNARKAKAF